MKFARKQNGYWVGLAIDGSVEIEEEDRVKSAMEEALRKLQKQTKD